MRLFAQTYASRVRHSSQSASSLRPQLNTPHRGTFSRHCFLLESSIMSKTYGSRITEQQKHILVEYMENHRQLISGLLTRTFSQADKTRMWTELAEIVNACGSGAAKSVDEWKAKWGDLKSSVKKKILKQRKSIRETGGGWFRANPLTEVEEKIAALMGTATISGIEGCLDSADQSTASSIHEDDHVAPADNASTLQVHPSAPNYTYIVPPGASSFSLMVPNLPDTSSHISEPAAASSDSGLADNSSEKPTDRFSLTTTNNTARNRNIKRKRNELERTEAAVGSILNAQEAQAKATNEMAEAQKHLIVLKERKIEILERQVLATERHNELLRQLLTFLIEKNC